MREYKFRGKNNNGKWIYGTGIVQVEHNTYDTDKWELVQKVNYDELDYFIPSYETEEIDINTIGQYTGLKDKNGKEIYEGDIIYVNPEDEVAFILWDEETARYIIQFKGWCADFDNYYGKELEVIGNIYNNPELLEEKE